MASYKLPPHILYRSSTDLLHVASLVVLHVSVIDVRSTPNLGQYYHFFKNKQLGKIEIYFANMFLNT